MTRPGVTAAFNKNLLARANRELDADFDLDAFAHYAPYNPQAQRIEMYLVSLKRQSVRLERADRLHLRPGEAMHTEDSHKYTIESFREIAARAGFMPRAVWTDEDRLCSHSLAGKPLGRRSGRHQQDGASSSPFSTAVAVLPKNKLFAGRGR